MLETSWVYCSGVMLAAYIVLSCDGVKFHLFIYFLFIFPVLVNLPALPEVQGLVGHL